MAERLQKLERRGIVAWEVSGALARLTKAQSGATDAARAVLRDIVTLGAQMALAIRRRVQERGDLGDQRFPGYARGKVKYHPQYARMAHLSPTPWRWPKQEDENSQVLIRDRDMNVTQRIPTFTYKSRADIQRELGKPDGSYTVTGGMWEGLQARGSQRSTVILDFAGTSVGAGKSHKYRTYYVSGYTADGRPMTRGGWVSARSPAKVRNNQKAYGIYQAHSIHVLKPTQAELDQFGATLTKTANSWVELQLRGG